MNKEKSGIFESKKGLKPFVAAVALSVASLFPGVSKADQEQLQQSAELTAQGDVESAKKILEVMSPKAREHVSKAFDMVDRLGDKELFSESHIAEHPSLKAAIATVAKKVSSMEVPDTSQFDITPGSATKDILSGRTSRNTSSSGK